MKDKKPRKTMNLIELCDHPEMNEEFAQEFFKQLDARKQLYDAVSKTTDRLYKETSVVHYSPMEQAMKQWLDGIKESKKNTPHENDKE